MTKKTNKPIKRRLKKKREKMIGEYFRLAFILYIKKGRPRVDKKWGTQKSISKALNIQPTYLSDFLSGKKPVSEKIRVTLAEYIGFNYQELIALGRLIHNNSVIYENKTRDIIYSKGFPKNMREQFNISPEIFATMLKISTTEYIFKEDGVIEFKDNELKLLSRNIHFLIDKNKQKVKTKSGLRKIILKLRKSQSEVRSMIPKLVDLLEKNNLIKPKKNRLKSDDRKS